MRQVVGVKTISLSAPSLDDRYTLQRLRNPVWLFVGLSTPLLYLALFTPLLRHLSSVQAIGSGSVLQEFLPGFLAVIQGCNLPVLLLGGVLLPISLGPMWMRVLAHFNPLYYLVEAARSLSLGSFAGSATWHAFAVLGPLCLLTVAWATRVYRRAVS